MSHCLLLERRGSGGNEVPRVVGSQFVKEFALRLLKCLNPLLFLEPCLYWDWESAGRVKCIGALGTQRMCGEKKGWWREFHRKERWEHKNLYLKSEEKPSLVGELKMKQKQNPDCCLGSCPHVGFRETLKGMLSELRCSLSVSQ